MYYFKGTCFSIAIVLFSISSTPVNASLIDDTIFFRQAYDDGTGMVYHDEVIPSVEIIAIGPIVDGDADKTEILSGVSNPPTIDADASSFSLEFYNVAQSFGSGFDFNGYVISDFDYAPGYVLSGVSVQNNLINWDGGTAINFADDTPLTFTERISFTDDTVFLDFDGLSFRVTGDLNFELSFSPVPLPPAIWLFITGVIGIAGFSWKGRRIKTTL